MRISALVFILVLTLSTAYNFFPGDASSGPIDIYAAMPDETEPQSIPTIVEQLATPTTTPIVTVATTTMAPPPAATFMSYGTSTEPTSVQLITIPIVIEAELPPIVEEELYIPEEDKGEQLILPARAVAPPIDGGVNFATAWNFLIDNGFTPEAAAGILGNLRAETTTINPSAINRGDGADGSDSIGIIQWNSSRAQALRTFARDRGAEWNCLETQLAFLIHEMPSNDSFFNNHSIMRNASGKGVTVALTNGAAEYMTLTDVEYAARIFDAAYVRSPGNANQRARWAREFYEMFTGEYGIQ
jgi:hypothetical protein